MKNRIKQYLLAASMCVGLTACSDFFEPIPGVQFGLDETFASKQRTEEYLNNVYSYVREVTDAIHPNTYGGIFTEASLDGANRWNKTYAEWTNGSFNSASAQASEYFSKYRRAWHLSHGPYWQLCIPMKLLFRVLSLLGQHQ